MEARKGSKEGREGSRMKGRTSMMGSEQNKCIPRERYWREGGRKINWLKSCPKTRNVSEEGRGAMRWLNEWPNESNSSVDGSGGSGLL